MGLVAWVMMVENDVLPLGGIFDHFLWALLFMKLYPENESDLCGKLGCSEKTARKYIWPMIDAISELGYVVIDFDNRYKGDTGNDCLLSVDGTDLILAMSYMKELWSYKFKHCGLRYEV